MIDEAYDYDDYDTMAYYSRLLDTAERVLEAIKLYQASQEIVKAYDDTCIREENYLLGYCHRRW